MIDSLREQMNTILLSAQSQAEETSRKAVLKARLDLADRLNHAVRSFVQAENVPQWKDVLLDSVQGFCGRAALLQVGEDTFSLDIGRGFSGQKFLVKREAAPALQQALEEGETTVAANVASEVSSTIAEFAQGSVKIFLFPIISNGKKPGLLLADGVIEQSAVEMICNAAGLALEKAQKKSQEITNIAVVPDLMKTRTEAAASTPLWAEYPMPARLKHARAQRFARTLVAEMQLYHSSAVRSGRKAANLYSSLQAQIDTARSRFKDEFQPGEQTMIDYLHLELTETLANNETKLLGADYPGPLA